MLTVFVRVCLWLGVQKAAVEIYTPRRCRHQVMYRTGVAEPDMFLRTQHDRHAEPRRNGTSLPFSLPTNKYACVLYIQQQCSASEYQLDKFYSAPDLILRP